MPEFDLPPPSEKVIDRASELLIARGVRVTKGVAISRFTTFRVGGPAALLAEVEDVEQLTAVGEVAESLKVPSMVLGRGSNVLVSDEGFPGVVVRMRRGFDQITGLGNEVRAGAAASLPQVANWASRRALSGLEFSIAIPASVGGAVKMNAGAHGSSVSDVLSSAQVCHLATGEVRDISVDELAMSYRSSSLGPSDVVCSATFLLVSADAEQIAAKMEANRKHRADTQPIDAPNAGSMFKNPQGASAGALIEGSGLKGKRVGKAEVSVKHANFFLGRDGASAQDVYDLMALVQEVVSREHSVLLVPEVRLVGRYRDPERLREHP